MIKKANIVKRAAALFIACIMILSETVLPVSAKDSKIGFEEQFALLGGLHLVAADEETYSETEVTRGRFAKEMAAFLGINAKLDTKQYYYDVDGENEYAPYINSIKEYGYMVGENGYFRPEDRIMKIEILKAVISALGYERLAQYYGGYKDGYIKVASDFGIADGIVNYDAFASYSDMVRIFYNTLDADIVSLNFTDGKVTNERSNINFLKKFHDLTEGEGQITGTYFTATDGLGETGENAVRIDGKSYEVTEEALPIGDYLGYRIKFWYNKDNEIVYFTNNKTEELVIAADDFESYKSGELHYSIGEKTKRANISKTASVIYNGSDVTSKGYSDNIFNISLGTIELIKSENSSAYDIVKIYEYENFVVSSVSEKNSQIYIKGRDKKIGLDSYKKYYLRGAGGEAKKLGDISENNILSIGENIDKTIAYIIISDKSIVGNIIETGTDDKGRNAVTINGEQIALDNNFGLNCDINLSTGMEIEAYLDYKGRMAYAKFSANTLEWKYGYMTRLYSDDENCGIRIYTQDGEFKTYSLPEKVSLDGVRMLSELAVAEVADMGGGKVVPQLIKYIAVGENVTKIDTAKPAKSEKSKKNLSLYIDTKLRYANENQRFHYYGSDYAWNNYFTALKADENTIVFVVPQSEEDQRKYEKLYSHYKGYGYFWTPREPIYNIAAYDVDEDNGDIAKVIVVKGGKENEYGDNIVVDSIESKVNSDDEIVTVINGYSCAARADKSWELEDSVKTFSAHYNKTADNGAGMNVEYLEVPLKDLKRGDIINVSKGSTGKVIGIRRKFGLAHLETSMEVLDSNGNLITRTSRGTFIQKHGVINISGIHIGSGGGSEGTEMIGVITDRNGKYLHFANMNPKTETTDQRGNISLELNGCPIVHYSSKRNKYELISGDDIDGYIYSSNKQAICFVFTCYTNMRMMVIYD